MRKFHDGAQRDMPEVRHVREYEWVQLMAAESALTAFGICCRRLRTAAGLTISDQAAQMKMSSAEISKIEMGLTPVTSDYLRSFCRWAHADEDLRLELGHV